MQLYEEQQRKITEVEKELERILIEGLELMEKEGLPDYEFEHWMTSRLIGMKGINIIGATGTPSGCYSTLVVFAPAAHGNSKLHLDKLMPAVTLHWVRCNPQQTYVICPKAVHKSFQRGQWNDWSDWYVKAQRAFICLPFEVIRGKVTIRRGRPTPM